MTMILAAVSLSLGATIDTEFQPTEPVSVVVEQATENDSEDEPEGVCIDAMEVGPPDYVSSVNYDAVWYIDIGACVVEEGDDMPTLIPDYHENGPSVL